MFKKIKFILTLGLLMSGFVFLNSQTAIADCNPGHYSTGNQSLGGPNSRWELVCDEASEAIGCISHPDEEEEETIG
ncbi:hypothetical protein SAMN04487988_109169 [Algoriphagus hitonicola]|uniref:Secreted protein n=1 Tax=Algoriphagus hitonicola TaxID=435880 RepID=A0A1I2VKK5_9BACT|nr:hypothetical protein SAMN04487988_109169 [Algoriphagus hitonicola]